MESSSNLLLESRVEELKQILSISIPLMITFILLDFELDLQQHENWKKEKKTMEGKKTNLFTGQDTPSFFIFLPRFFLLPAAYLPVFLSSPFFVFSSFTIIR